MRERLSLAFALLAVVLLAGVGLVQCWTVTENLREQDSRLLRHDADVARLLVEDRLEAGRRVDADFLEGLVRPEEQIRWAPAAGPEVVATGPEYDNDATGELSATGLAGRGQVSVARADRSMVALVRDEWWSVLAMLVVGVLCAVVLGLVVSRLLAAPFRRLAVAAAALGRGRFDLDLPRTRVPEARAIGQALGASAAQLRDRVARDRQFAAYASHELRSPLTGVRLELEDLAQRGDLPADARDAVTRCVAGVDQVEGVAGDLVALHRGTLIEDAVVPLHELASQSAQRWADVLVRRDRLVTAAVEGALEQPYTPGPVEQVLDLLLEAVVRDTRGEVRLVLDGNDDGTLRITVTAAAPAEARRSRRLRERDDRWGRVRETCESFGGRLVAASPADGMVLLLPRR
ncbi:histidine kinase dimerization/phospho-acceptor domain-containing protein [Nocardioides pantholopis]|uniref:histidine kinase dimerization/phospho-acceptor domain-containing protein n=1 Tax=Nocardioides pantholopis TaxID=2483798 RepID=UPI000F0920C3|nr:histidine kinase dimerization/phospho-acceptor domain-containing protein [Nocardioides pantholopis]